MTVDAKTRAIIAEANEWLVRIMDPGATPEDEAGFAAWLRASPVHVREYLRAEAVYAAMAGVDAEKRIDVEALLAADGANVVELGRVVPRTGGEVSQPVSGVEGDWSAPRRLWATAASVLIVIAAAAALYIQTTGPEIYATARGEQRRLVLDDGSVVDMNTETELSVWMDDDGRHVELMKGEALFTVAKDPGRPFVVDGDLALVRALGTQFNVYRQTEQMLVTVLEGRVAVEQQSRLRTPAASGEVAMIEITPVELGAGDQAAIMPQAPIRTMPANLEKTVAWRERRLIFENQPLSEVVAEFNRYNRRQLVIEDTDLANQRISAVFDADQPEALVRFLTQNTPIRVSETDGERLVLRAN